MSRLSRNGRPFLILCRHRAGKNYNDIEMTACKPKLCWNRCRLKMVALNWNYLEIVVFDQNWIERDDVKIVVLNQNDAETVAISQNKTQLWWNSRLKPKFHGNNRLKPNETCSCIQNGRLKPKLHCNTWLKPNVCWILSVNQICWDGYPGTKCALKIWNCK